MLPPSTFCNFSKRILSHSDERPVGILKMWIEILKYDNMWLSNLKCELRLEILKYGEMWLEIWKYDSGNVTKKFDTMWQTNRKWERRLEFLKYVFYVARNLKKRFWKCDYKLWYYVAINTEMWKATRNSEICCYVAKILGIWFWKCHKKLWYYVATNEKYDTRRLWILICEMWPEILKCDTINSEMWIETLNMR